MSKPEANHTRRGEATADKQREIQREQDRKDETKAQRGDDKPKQAVQAGEREQPAPPLPAQHPTTKAATSCSAWRR